MKLEPANLVCPACGNGNYMRHLIGENVGWLNLKCINCNSYFNFEDLLQRQSGLPGAKTNYDTIVSKTPEELANFMWNVESSGRLYGPRGRKLWLDWLRQEVSE